MILGARFHRLEHHLHDLAVGLPLRGRHRLPVDIHGRLNRRVTHEFLLHFHGRSGLVQPRTIGMAEGMPTNRTELSGSGLPFLVDE